MSKNGKRKYLISQIHKKFTSREFFYPTDYKGPPKFTGYGLMPIPR